MSIHTHKYIYVKAFPTKILLLKDKYIDYKWVKVNKQKYPPQKSVKY